MIHKNGALESTQSIREKRKGLTKYKYVNRINEILNDEFECEELQRGAENIRKTRKQMALKNPKSRTSPSGGRGSSP